MPNKTQICPNCEREHEVHFSFCPYCGQKTEDELTLGNLFYNTISNYFSFDARFFKSFIPLLTRPGYLAKSFVSGRRLMYLHPAQMYLFVSVIFFFLFSFVQRDQVRKINEALQEEKLNRRAKPIDSLGLAVLDTTQINKFTENLKGNPQKFGMSEKEAATLDSILDKKINENKDNMVNFDFNDNEIDSLITAGATDSQVYKFMGMDDDAGYFERKFYAQILKFYKNRDGGSILQTVYDTIPIAMFFLLPIFALLIFLFYIKKGRFAHHLVFSFYFFSFLFAVFAIITGINLIWDIPDWIDWLIVMSTFLYFLFSLKRYYEQGWFLTFVKGSILSFLFLSIVLPLAAGSVFIYAFLFY